MAKYNTEAAYEFYREHILNEERQTLLAEHNLPTTGSVPSIDWELLAAILTGDQGKAGYGSDLMHYEVKSSVAGSGFEYQYHLNGGEAKLLEDMAVDHIFFSYSKDYRHIEVRLVRGAQFRKTFKSWLPGLKENYRGSNRKQRYRKGISYGIVTTEGKLVLKIEDGRLVSL